MKPRTLLVALLAAASAPALAQTTTGDVATQIEALFSARPADAPGCVVNVTQNGETVIKKAFGLADLERGVPNTTGTVFEIGSVSKQFTAAALLLLEQDGKLKMTDDFRTYLPEMPDYGTPITLEMLLNHTSGLRDWGSVSAASGKGRGERNFSNAEVLDIAARQKELNYKPGAEYSYNNTGYNLAAIIVERVSGKSFMEFTRERMFAPLGMTSAQWRDDHNRIVKNRAMAYTPTLAGYQQSMPFMDVYGNGGLMMTISDLTRWNEAMMANALGLRAAMEKISKLSDGRGIPYARGVNVLSHNGVTEVLHGGVTGGYNAWLARYPDRKLSLAIMCNAPPPMALPPTGLANLLLGAAPPVTHATNQPAPDAYAGLFVNTRTGMPLTLSVESGELLSNGRATTRLSTSKWRRGAEDYAFPNPDTLEVASSDGNRFTYVRIAPASVTTQQLAAYAGVYTSDETLATYTVSIKDGQLRVNTAGWPDAVLSLSPVYTDAFMTPGGVLVRFRRGSDGQINEMSLGDGRMRDLRAARTK